MTDFPIPDEFYFEIARRTIMRAFLDLRNPKRQQDAELWLCCSEGRIWVKLAQMDYDDIMRQAETILDMPTIDRRNGGQHRPHKKHVWRRHKTA